MVPQVHIERFVLRKLKDTCGDITNVCTAFEIIWNTEVFLKIQLRKDRNKSKGPWLLRQRSEVAKPGSTNKKPGVRVSTTRKPVRRIARWEQQPRTTDRIQRVG